MMRLIFLSQIAFSHLFYAVPVVADYGPIVAVFGVKD